MSNGKTESDFVDMFAQFYEKFFSASADAVELLAAIQEKHVEEYKSIKEFSTNPQAIDILLRTISAEQQAMLLKILLKAGQFSKDMVNLLQITPEQQKQLAYNLKTFAEDLSKQIKMIRHVSDTQELDEVKK